MGESRKERHHMQYIAAYGNRIIKLILKMTDLDWMLLAQDRNTLHAFVKRVLDF
jgi:hypothetical protein